MNGHPAHAVLLALVTVFLFAPVLALAQCPTDSDALIYEVAEMVTFKKGAGDQLKSRQATSTIFGKVREGTPFCPPSLAQQGQCTASVIASNFIRLDTGDPVEGPIHGDFYILGPGLEPNLVDADEVILIHGTLRGTVKVFSNLPLAELVNANLQGRGAKDTPVANQSFRANVTGIFRIPFEVDGVASYLCPGGPVPVTPDERSLGKATVRLEITFE